MMLFETLNVALALMTSLPPTTRMAVPVFGIVLSWTAGVVVPGDTILKLN